MFSLYYSYRTLRDLHSFPTRRSSDLTGGVQLAREVERRLTAHRRQHRVGPLATEDVGDAFEVERLQVRRSEEHTSELQSLRHLVCRLLLEKKKTKNSNCT